MRFQIMFNRIAPRLKSLAMRHRSYNLWADTDDLYQEMCVYLWNNYRHGVPSGVNDAYIVKGCEFHVLNYLRKAREKASVVSLDVPINEYGDTLKDVLPDQKEPSAASLERDLTINETTYVYGIGNVIDSLASFGWKLEILNLFN